MPIHAVVPGVLDKLQVAKNMILQAPTGAGKTTIVPLAVLESGCVKGRVLVLQPRRITCVNVARRMAELWGEPLGETVGYRIRHESVVSNRTQIEVITEGILVRLLLTNPSLEGVGCIFFDEFHERSIDSDVSFALVLDAQRRGDLPVRLVVMSATFGGVGPRVTQLLGKECSVIRSEGRCFPVEIKYRGLINLKNFEPNGPQQFAGVVAGEVKAALEQHSGDMLVFLPGEREIMYTWIALNNLGIGDGNQPRKLVAWARRLIDTSVDLSASKVQVCPLYATLDIQEQDEVLQPPPVGWRKVILATPIAESSLTVPGVRIVVDAGLRKTKVTEPDTCMSYMHTIPISRASADQRSGRAGRVSEGVCYRLWDERQQRQLAQNDEPEIDRADLAGVVLDLVMAGHRTNQEIYCLPWVDTPKVQALDHGRRLLLRLQALERLQGGRWEITDRGQRLGGFPVHPRISHMIQQAAQVSRSFLRDACDLAALLEERELLKGGRNDHGADLEARLDALQDLSSPKGILFTVKERVLKASEQLQRLAQVGHVVAGRPQQAPERRCLSVLVTWAFPELLARTGPQPAHGGRGKGPTVFKLANGYEAIVDRRDALSGAPCLAIASLTGRKVFWAIRANSSVLASFGVQAHDPVNHRLLDAAVRRGQVTPNLVSVRRYLVGKGFGGIETVDDVLSAVMEQPGKFPPDELKKMVWDLARQEQEELLRRIMEEAVAPRVAEFTAPQLVEVACAMGVAGVDAPAAREAVAEAVLPSLDELPLDSEEGGLSGLLWAFTVMEHLPPELCDGMVQRALATLREFQPLVLSDVREICFWSFLRASAKAWGAQTSSARPDRGFAHRDFFDALAPAVVERLDDIHPISCVYIMWSFIKAGVTHEELFESIATRVGPEAGDLDRCGLTMFCWNFAFGEIENYDVYECVARETLRPERMAEMAPRDVGGISWAYARAKMTREDGCEKLLPALVRHGVGLLRDGLAQRCYCGPQKSLAREVYEGDNSAVDGAVDAFDSVSLADVLWACAEAQFRDEEFLQLCSEYMTRGLRQPRFNVTRFIRSPSVLAKALHAYTRLSLRPRSLYKAAAPHFLRGMDSLRIRQVASLIFVYAVSGSTEPWLLAALDARLRALVGAGGRGQLSEMEVADLTWGLNELGLGDAELQGQLAQLSH